MNIGKYDEAINVFEAIDGYKDSADKVNECNTFIKEAKYNNAVILIEEGKYENAKKIFLSLDGYKESQLFISKCNDKINENAYNVALNLFSSKKYSEAIVAFQALGNYKDSITKIKEVKYAEGEYMLSQKNYSKAIEIFSELGNYLKAPDKLIQSKYEYGNYYFKNAQYRNAIEYYEQVGSYLNAETMLLKSKIQLTSVKSTIKFGNYEQDNNINNGEEEIEWIILAKESGRALLISKECLDFKPFHNKNTSITWKSCSLRTWLNSTFYNTAFDAKYNQLIVSSTISNVGCGDTIDKVFLPSETEVLTYFNSDGDRQAKATKYAQSLGAEVNQYTYSTQWMLRTPGYINSVPMFVRLPGDLSSHNDSYSYEKKEYTAVRPAIWVDLNV